MKPEDICSFQEKLRRAFVATQELSASLRWQKLDKHHQDRDSYLSALYLAIRYCISCPSSLIYLDQEPPDPKKNVHLGCRQKINATNLTRDAVYCEEIKCPKRPKKHPFKELLNH
jgi:hypothetical protein